jgi:hypothetical protein
LFVGSIVVGVVLAPVLMQRTCALPPVDVRATTPAYWRS